MMSRQGYGNILVKKGASVAFWWFSRERNRILNSKRVEGDGKGVNLHKKSMLAIKVASRLSTNWASTFSCGENVYSLLFVISRMASAKF